MAGKVVVSAAILAVGIALALAETGREHVIDVLRRDALVLFVLAWGVGSRLVVDQGLREGDGGRDGQGKEGLHCCFVLLDVRRRLWRVRELMREEVLRLSFETGIRARSSVTLYHMYLPPLKSPRLVSQQDS